MQQQPVQSSSRSTSPLPNANNDSSLQVSPSTFRLSDSTPPVPYSKRRLFADRLPPRSSSPSSRPRTRAQSTPKPPPVDRAKKTKQTRQPAKTPAGGAKKSKAPSLAKRSRTSANQDTIDSTSRADSDRQPTQFEIDVPSWALGKSNAQVSTRPVHNSHVLQRPHRETDADLILEEQMNEALAPPEDCFRQSERMDDDNTVESLTSVPNHQVDHQDDNDDMDSVTSLSDESPADEGQTASLPSQIATCPPAITWPSAAGSALLDVDDLFDCPTQDASSVTGTSPGSQSSTTAATVTSASVDKTNASPASGSSQSHTQLNFLGTSLVRLLPKTLSQEELDASTEQAGAHPSLSLQSSKSLIRSAIARSLDNSTSMARLIYKALEEPLSKESTALEAARVGAQVIETTRLFAKEVMERGLDEEESSPLAGNCSTPVSRLPTQRLSSRAHSSSFSPRDLFSVSSRSTYYVSITLRPNAKVDHPLRQIFEKATIGHKVHIARDSTPSSSSYQAILMEQDMVQTSLDAINTAMYKYKDSTEVPLSSLVIASSVAHSLYSARSGHIPSEALKPFLVNRKMDLEKFRAVVIPRNSTYFHSESDIEDVTRWPKRDLDDVWVFKIFMTIDAYKRLLTTRESLTTINLGSGTPGNPFRLYEDLVMPQCDRCNWVGHSGDNCEWGTWCDYCGSTQHVAPCPNRDDPKLLKCHRCHENNERRQSLPSGMRFKFFENWTYAKPDHVASLPTCPAAQANREWIRLYLKNAYAEGRQVSIYAPPREGPRPWWL